MAKAVPIYRSKIHEGMVQRLCIEEKFTESGKTLFPTIRELLTFAALLGFSDKRRIPLDKSKGTEDIQGSVYEFSGEPLELIWAVGVAETNGSDILKDGNERACAEIFEEYANGGLTIIANYLMAEPLKQTYRAIQKGMQNDGYILADMAPPSDETSIEIEY